MEGVVLAQVDRHRDVVAGALVGEGEGRGREGGERKVVSHNIYS